MLGVGDGGGVERGGFILFCCYSLSFIGLCSLLVVGLWDGLLFHGSRYSTGVCVCGGGGGGGGEGGG